MSFARTDITAMKKMFCRAMISAAKKDGRYRTIGQSIMLKEAEPIHFVAESANVFKITVLLSYPPQQSDHCRSTVKSA